MVAAISVPHLPSPTLAHKLKRETFSATFLLATLAVLEGSKTSRIGRPVQLGT